MGQLPCKEKPVGCRTLDGCLLFLPVEKGQNEIGQDTAAVFSLPMNTIGVRGGPRRPGEWLSQEMDMFALLRVAVALVAAIAFIVFVTRAQESLANGPLFSFVAHLQNVPMVLGAIFGVGVWTLLGRK